MTGHQSRDKAVEAEAYIDRVASLILVAVTIDDYIHSCIVKRVLHGQPHALVLLVVRHICTTCQKWVVRQQATRCCKCTVTSACALTESILEIPDLVAMLDMVSKQKVTATRLSQHQLVICCNSAADML